MKSRLDDTLLDTGALMKEAGTLLINNAGKLIALAVLILAAALTFTDVSFAALTPKDALPQLLLLIASSYVIYFSLESAGEQLGESTPEYTAAKERYDGLRGKITGDDIDPLRSFCNEYSKKELECRKRSLSLYLGIGDGELSEMANGGSVSKKAAHAYRRIQRMKPVAITPRVLLSKERSGRRSELESPERRKLGALFLRLIPSTVCMIITVSVILTTKDGLSGADVLNGILKLSALPVVGFKGYSQGYTFVKHKESAWLETKSNIIESFISERKKTPSLLDITGGMC